AFAMLESGVELRQVFLWTALPGALAVLLAATVREQPSSAPHPSHTLGTGAASQPLLPQGEGWDEGVKRPRPLDLSLTPTLSLGRGSRKAPVPRRILARAPRLGRTQRERSTKQRQSASAGRPYHRCSVATCWP
ncbi:hypothetical protein, partial [Methylogaea oryzae]|uniref:hypothetical protein n=1 Tax=Methylogaea oryzae TaxID=1295382 RepID=UPI001C3F416E